MSLINRLRLKVLRKIREDIPVELQKIAESNLKKQNPRDFDYVLACLNDTRAERLIYDAFWGDENVYSFIYKGIKVKPKIPIIHFVRLNLQITSAMRLIDKRVRLTSEVDPSAIKIINQGGSIDGVIGYYNNIVQGVAQLDTKQGTGDFLRIPEVLIANICEQYNFIKLKLIQETLSSMMKLIKEREIYINIDNSRETAYLQELENEHSGILEKRIQTNRTNYLPLLLRYIRLAVDQECDYNIFSLSDPIEDIYTTKIIGELINTALDFCTDYSARNNVLFNSNPLGEY